MITKQNYETWFLLYADNELSTEEQAQVFSFVESHPELKSEFEAIQQVKLLPEESVLMPEKERLKSSVFEHLEERYRVEPDLSIVYPNKKELYRKTSVISLSRWGSYVAAASVVLILGVFWLMGEKSEKFEGEIVKTSPAFNKPSIDAINQTDQNDVSEKSTVAAVEQTVKKEIPRKAEASMESIDPSLLVSSEIPKTDLIQEIIQPETIVVSQMQSNFPKEVLDAANERMKASPISAVVLASSPSPNMEALLKASMPQENENTPFKGLLRKFTRKVLHEDEDEDVKVIQVANFHIHVKN